jgi:tRNA dimethylallyltransferase
MKKKPVMVFILGPTGAGKSDFAVRLAEKIGGEIISCDSMQVYKGMPIMSQQPSSELRKVVPHYLVDVLSPLKEWSAANFVERAREIAEGIGRRKKVPIIVGGTGLYARAFIKGLFPSPPKDEKLRRALNEEAKKKGKKKLYERLLKIDPTYASKVHPNDLRRVIRALEVYELTGKAISEKHGEGEGIEAKYNVLIFILTGDRKELYRRIDERVEKMFAKGIVQEVKRLLKQKIGKTAKAVLGYKEVSDYINGKHSLEEAKELLNKNTRHYAKRQLTWFRREENAEWIELSTKKHNTLLLSEVARKIKAAAELRNR